MPELARILVVDDEQTMRVTLAEILQIEGYRVTTAANGHEAIARLGKEPFDLVLTDLRMPEVDGLAVIEAVRQLAPLTVVIVLTAHATLDSAIDALRHGAHDYLLKPARAPQILASVRAGLEKREELKRRENLLAAVQSAIGPVKLEKVEGEVPAAVPAAGRAEEGRFLAAHGVVVDRFKRMATAGGQPLDLTKVEYDLLVLLMQNIDQVLSATEIVRQVQGYAADDAEARAIVRVHISRLRQKIEQTGAPPLPVVNIRGVGYRLEAG